MPGVTIEISEGHHEPDAFAFAGQLAEMYRLYAALHGWVVEPPTDSGEMFRKPSMHRFVILSEEAAARLRYETGVHRVQRVPASDKLGRMHTSVAQVIVRPLDGGYNPGEDELRQKIRTYNFPDDRVTDHRIRFTLSGVRAILQGNLDPIIEELKKRGDFE